MGKGTVFVTGASTGIGRAAVDRLAKEGYDVLAGVRKESDAPASASGHVLIDLADPDGITTACKEVLSHGPLVGLVNNAGISVNGPCEVVPLEAWRRQFEVNLFGHLAVTKELLPPLLESKGRIITVGSIGGRFSAPFLAPYSASKFAIRAWMEALRVELAPHGVQAVLIEPGAIATEIWGKGNEVLDRTMDDATQEQRKRYEAQITSARRLAGFAERTAVPADVAAKVIAKALTSSNPKGRYLVGKDARLEAAVAVLPTRAMEGVTRLMFRQPKRG
ncbi:MAG: SDR family oxidoreductase [Actinomycetota bacterium]|nr:SDR family oxidoreductase [Actinomycetota bacterium]